MIFKVYGPFPIDLDEYGNVPLALNDFWNNVDKKQSGLSAAKGCYVFGIKTSGGSRILPWYIGRTNKQNFESECFKAHQRTHYSRAINHYDRAKPYLYLLARLTNGGKFYQGNTDRAISFVETYLIGSGLLANKDLLNKKDTKLFREITIPGILNGDKGAIGKAAADLKRSFYLDLT